MANILQKIFITHAKPALNFCGYQWQSIILFFVILIFICDVVCGEQELRIMMMPFENEYTTSQEPFTEDKNPFKPSIIFDNSPEEWKKLGIGYHYWICGELYKFAQEEESEKIIIHIFFISWERALMDIESHWSRYDIIQVPSTWTAFMINQRILHRLIIEPNSTDYPNKLLKTCGTEDQEGLYAVPWQIDMRFLFFSRSLADNPSELRGFKQFKDRLSRRAEEKKASGFENWKPLGISMEKDWDILHNVFNYFACCRIIEKKGEHWQVAFMDKTAHNGLKSLWELSQQDLVNYDEYKNTSGKSNWRRMAEGLVEGRYDAIIDGLRVVSVINKDPNEKILAARLPFLNTNDTCIYLGGSHLGITETAVGRGAAGRARKLIEQLASNKAGISMFENTEAVPANKNALAEFFSRNQSLRYLALDLDELLDSAASYPTIPQWAVIVEKRLGLNELYNAFQSIANGRQWEVVISELELAAGIMNEELRDRTALSITEVIWWKQPEFKMYSTISLVIICFIIAAICLSVIILKHIKKAEETLKETQEILEELCYKIKSYIIDTGPKILETLENTRKEIIQKDANANEGLTGLFNAVSTGITNIQQYAVNISESEKDLNNKLQELVNQTGTARETIDKIEQLTGKDLSKIEAWLIQIDEDVAELKCKIEPPRKWSLKDCELEANISSENGNVSLKLTIKHQQESWTFSNWKNEKTPLLFAFLHLQHTGNDYKYLYLGDYYLLNYPNPKFPKPGDVKEASRKLFAKIREDVFVALSSKCEIKNERGIEVVKKDLSEFMLTSYKSEQGQPTGSFNAPDMTIYSTKQGQKHKESSANISTLDNNSDLLKIAYKFILPDQVKDFTSVFDDKSEKDISNKIYEWLIEKSKDCSIWLSYWNRFKEHLSKKQKENIKKILPHLT